MAEGVIALMLALGLTTVLLALGAALWRLQRQLPALRGDSLRARIEIVEAARLQRAQQQLEQAGRIAETALGSGTEAVRLIHRGIAAIPFGILEAIPVTRDTTRVVRHTHDLIAGAVYGSIQAVNRGLGGGMRLHLRGGNAAVPGAATPALPAARSGASMDPDPDPDPDPTTDAVPIPGDGGARRRTPGA